MEKNRDYLINAYNATSTEDPPDSDQLETYEAWLERQLLYRIEKIEALVPLAILRSNCTLETMREAKDEWDVVNCNKGIVLFTGTAEQCKEWIQAYK